MSKKYLVSTRSAICLLVAFLLAAAMVGLLCGLLPRCERDSNPPVPVKEPWEYVRLPGTVTPTSYDLLVRTDLTNSLFTGTVEVLMTCLEATDLILIHGKSLTVSGGRTTLARHGGGVAPKLAKDPWISEPNDFIVIQLEEKLEKNAQYLLHIEFQGPLLDDSLGYYKMSYKTASGEERYLASTFFDPVDARKAFPCFDEPALKATFKITLEHRAKYHALANTQKSLPDQTLSDGWIRATFKKSVVMPTYLVCYVISDFKDKAKNTTNGVLFRVWAQEDYIDQVDYALDRGAAILDYFDDLYGEDNNYPLAKMDMIALPEFTAGAMENWGLITYRETALLYKEGVSSESQKQRVCTIVAHELAHQWFGNLVTMEWWSHLWLNEGFASYVEYVGTAAVEKDWYMWDKFLVYDLYRAMATDSLVTSRPMVTDVLVPSEIQTLFDRISYQKGASILRMMNQFLGETTFVKGLQKYLKTLKYDNAKSSDLWHHLQEAVTEDGINLGEGLTVATIMDTWTLQMGFPFVKVDRDYSKNNQITARVEQKRFLSDPNSDPTPDLEYKWYVPVTFTTPTLQKSNASSYIWLKPKDESGQIQIPNGNNKEWLLVNVDQTGMYRVNYDDRNWEMITEQLETLHTAIPAASRAALISDAFSLAMAGEISYKRALDLTRYLKEERDYVPWYAFAGALGSIESNLMLKGAYGNFKKYMKEQVTPMYEHVGWDDEGDHITRLSRGRAISMACQYGNEDCTQTSIALYTEWKKNIQQTLTPNIHPDMQATAFCAAIEAGGQDEWNFAFNIYQNPNISTSVKSALLTAMACSRKPWILSKYLQSSLDSKIIRAQDMEDVVTAVARNPVGLPLAWDFFRANWDFLRAEFGDTVFLLDSMISGITSYFNTEHKLQTVKTFMAEHPDQGTGGRAFTEAVAVIEANIRWMNNQYDSVNKWLNATVNKPKIWEEVRLPKSLIPEHYDLTVRTDLTNFVFNGSVNIIMECRERTNIILLHSKELTLTGGTAAVKRVDGGPTPTRSKDIWLYEPNQFLVVELNSYLVPGERYSLYLEFQRTLGEEMKGYYLTNYVTEAEDTRYLASTSFTPSHARMAFPCFDEPALKATFNITLEHPPQYHALANMPKIREEMLDDGWMRSTFENSVVMSTYIVCYVVSDFVSLNTTTAHNVTFSVWAQEDLIKDAEYALQVGSAILDFFDSLYGMDIKYPLSKIDMVALPEYYFGAMENWGLIVYRKTTLLYREGVSTEVRKQRVCTIVAHELVHQWFGNLVTMDWWDYVWLNEGFASYVEYIGTDFYEPDFKIWDKFVLYNLQGAMDTDALVTSRPIVIPMSNPAEFLSMFDSISYEKGSSVLRMIGYFLGEKTFTRGLQNYLRALQYQTATNSDLWQHLQQVAVEDGVDLGTGQNVSTIMKTWTEQMGFPCVTITRVYGGELNKITARGTQGRFLTDPASDTGSSRYQDLGYKWHIPLTYTTGVSPEFENPEMQWMSTQENAQLEGLGSDTDWLLVNVNERGFYRVNYDETNWKLLARQLRNNHTVISTTSRSALISDAFNLARAGDLEHVVALDLLGYLTQETEYVPWSTVDNALYYIRAKLDFTPANATFASYMRMQIQQMYEYVGWDNVGSHHQKLSRSRIIRMACFYELSNCTMEASNRYNSWMADMKQNPVAEGLEDTVFCTGIAEGGLNEWEFAFNIYTNKDYTGTAFKYKLEKAMACSKDMNILDRYLDAVLNTSLVFAQDGIDVVIGVASNPVGTDLAWKFFQDNWDYLRRTYGNSGYKLDRLVSIFLSTFNTPEQLKEVEDFMEENPDQRMAQAFNQAVAKINNNIHWIEQNYDEIEEWLDNVGKQPWERVRLPDTLRPITYDLKVRTDLTKLFFNGSMDILIECFEKTDIVLIHNKNLTIASGATTLVSDGDGSTVQFKRDPWLYKPNEFVVIELDSLLDPGEKYWLHLEFENDLMDDRQGYYFSTYKPKSGGKRYLASTFFDPVDARKAFPCFDEPDMKATFRIVLEHEPQYHALANMPKIEEETLDGGWIRATFNESVVMSTYLVCYVISDFKAKFMTTENGVKFGVWAQEDSINQTDYALLKGVQVLDHFDKLYGLDIKYPLPKLDMVALPDFTAGAMENWGLITYRETALFYEEGVSSESRKQRVCTIIAHELAHQWFGNLVTLKWWDYLWLNEGFASWVEYVGTAEVEKDWAMWDKFVIYDLNPAMAVDALATSRPIVAKTLTPSEITEMFDRITYRKGASVLRMASHFIGEKTFEKGLRYYLRALQYRGAENKDLWFYVDKAIKEDNNSGYLVDGTTNVASVMDTWTNQMGYPVVTVTRTYSGIDDQITARATQKRFLIDPAADTTSPYPDLGYLWHVPLTYTTRANPAANNLHWMRPQDKNTEIVLKTSGGDDDWLLVNVDEIGFYSVNYDDANWNMLSQQLKDNYTVISVPSRSALIYDAFSLARAGHLSQTKALELIAYLNQERDYVPWYTVNSVLGYIADNLALEAANDNFRTYMKAKVTPMYEAVGWDNDGDHLQRLSRATAIRLACRYGNEDCISESKRLYGDWMISSSVADIQPDLQTTVFCTAIAEGGTSEWETAFDTYIDPQTDSSLKSVLQSAMACSRDAAILSKYLEQVLNTTLIRSQDGQAVVSAVAGKPDGRKLAWDFFVDNWDFFRNTYGNGVFLFDNVIGAVTSDLNKQLELDEVREFMRTHPDQGTGSRAFTQSLAVISANIRWMGQNYDEVADWLERNV